MRIDLSREEETRILPSDSDELVSINAFQKELVERIGCRVQRNTYESFKEFFEFLMERKKYWLLPIIIVLALFGILIVLSQGSVIAPFIYTIF